MRSLDLYTLLHPESLEALEALTKTAKAGGPKTFAQTLVERILPEGMEVVRPLDKKEVERILSAVFSEHPEQYSQVVSALKKLGDTFSTYESISFGMDDIEAPNKKERDVIFKRYGALIDKAKNDDEKIEHLSAAQNELAENDLKDAKGSASLMITSGGMGGKKAQLMKLRTTPAVLTNYKGELIPRLVTKSYAEGVGIQDYWDGAAEARSNLMMGQVQTSEPGVINKVTHNLLNDVVISMGDCGTKQGISLFTKDEDVLDRYLASAVGKYPRDTLVTSDVQQALLRAKVEKLLVRSPQTCIAPENTVCSRCYGKSVSHRKNHEIGTNVGTLTAGSLSEISVQLVLSRKHSTTLAHKPGDLEGIKGLKTVTEMPKIYPNQEVVAELFGVVHRIMMAPQGGSFIQIRRTRKVPDRYIVDALPIEGMSDLYVQYYSPPQRKLLDHVKKDAEVYPGMVLTDGNRNLKSVARLAGVGVARTEAVNMIREVYRTTGNSPDRRHFEILAKSMLNYIRIEKSPPGFPFRRGEIVQYSRFREAANKLQGRPVKLDNAMGLVMAEEVQGITIGTELTPPVIALLRQGGVKQVKVMADIEVSAVVAPLSRVQNMAEDNILGRLNHRYLGNTLQNAATQGQVQKVQSYNPVAAYAIGAYGSEHNTGDAKGKYG